MVKFSVKYLFKNEQQDSIESKHFLRSQYHLNLNPERDNTKIDNCRTISLMYLYTKKKQQNTKRIQ